MTVQMIFEMFEKYHYAILNVPNISYQDLTKIQYTLVLSKPR